MANCSVSLWFADLKSEIDVKQKVTKASDSIADRTDASRMADSGYDGQQQAAATPTSTSPTTPTSKTTPTTPTSKGVWLLINLTLHREFIQTSVRHGENSVIGKVCVKRVGIFFVCFVFVNWGHCCRFVLKRTDNCRILILFVKVTGM